MEKEKEIELKHFDSGAVRQKEDSHARFDLISPIGLRRLAETYGEGAIKYNDENWLKGINAKNLMNHALVHINKWLAGDKTEDHLAHASWNLFAIMHFEETRPELIDITTRISGFEQVKEMIKKGMDTLNSIPGPSYGTIYTCEFCRESGFSRHDLIIHAIFNHDASFLHTQNKLAVGSQNQQL